MGQQLIASGVGLREFKEAVSRTSGKGTTVLELDVQDRIALRFLPDLPVGTTVKAALPALDVSIQAVPGLHLVAPSTYAVRGDIGTLRLHVRTNPLVFLPVALPTLIIAIFAGLSIAGISVVVGWRILKADPFSFMIMFLVLAMVGLVAFMVWRNPSALGATAKALRG